MKFRVFGFNPNPFGANAVDSAAEEFAQKIAKNQQQRILNDKEIWERRPLQTHST